MRLDGDPFFFNLIGRESFRSRQRLPDWLRAVAVMSWFPWRVYDIGRGGGSFERKKIKYQSFNHYLSNKAFCWSFILGLNINISLYGNGVNGKVILNVNRKHKKRFFFPHI